ncbi:MAG: sensor histidine kinase [Sphingobacteriia bacterium]|nr:sensor histidine kinase [Sphingobacteriia bacterium]NCC39760.1 sensor histidine kinase [Gammaproteobacteria bacterium]
MIKAARGLLPRHSLFWKYFIDVFLLVGCALLASEAIRVYFASQETAAAVLALQREKALAAAARIEQFVTDIERQIGWTSLPHASNDDVLAERQLDLIKLLRQVPAITEASWLDARGHEQVRVSRLRMDQLGQDHDRSDEPAFRVAAAGQTYLGPVYHEHETEPFMRIAVPSLLRSEGVTLAEVNLKLVWDLVSRIRVGKSGYAYVVDRRGQLVSHPDISRVLGKSDLSDLPQVSAALASRPEPHAEPCDSVVGQDPSGSAVLATHASIPRLDWLVFVEQPLAEAHAPLYAALRRTAILLLIALALTLLVSLALARHMAKPIRVLQQGAARMGAGELDQPIQVPTGDELQTLAEELNRMAERLRESYADLERKVAERTRELELANQSRARFLRAASHDLRQPMHALGLFVAQLTQRASAPETRRIAAQAEVAVASLQDLLDAILDISRLDAGVVAPEISDFCVDALLERVATSFAPSAVEKGLRLHLVPSRLCVRSDPLLLERILLNLTANAVRYTQRGGIAIGCRRRGQQVRVLVCDTGIGITPAQQESIFDEFYQAANPEHDRRQGLGLGLAIAKRLARLLGGDIQLRSRPGRGSVFAVEVPRGHCLPGPPPARAAIGPTNALLGTLVLVVDDDLLVRDALQGLLSQWGCEVAVAATAEEASALLAASDRLPDALLCDYRLTGEETGLMVIQRLHAEAGISIPTALISGDSTPESLREIKASGYPLLPKPVAPARLRALLEHLVASPTHSPVDSPVGATSAAKSCDADGAEQVG